MEFRAIIWAEQQFLSLWVGFSSLIVSVLERIRVRPKKCLTKLAGLPYYKLRVGDYRLIIDLHKDVMSIYIIKTGHRNNAHKRVGKL